MMMLRTIGAALSLLWLGAWAPVIAAPPLEIYGRLPAVEAAAVSPSGKRVVLIGEGAEGRNLTVVQDGQPILRTGLADQKIRRVSWAGDNRILIEMSNTVNLGVGFTAAKTERSAVVVVPLTGEPLWSIFEGYTRITGGVSGSYGVVGDDFRHGYFSGITMERKKNGETYLGDTSPELYQVDLQTRNIKLVARRLAGTDGWRDWQMAPDGTVAATLDFFSRSGDWRIRNAGGEVIASGNSRTGDISMISLGRTPGTIIYIVGKEEDSTRKLVEQPVAGGPAAEILAGEYIRGYHIDRRTQQLIGFVREGDIPEDIFFEPNRDRMMAAIRKAFPGLRVELLDHDDDFTRLLLRTSGPGDPDTWWMLDTKTREATDLGTAYPLQPADVGPMRMVEYKAADGLEMAGVLTLPPGREAKNLPLVMLPHGGPPARDYPEFDYWAQAFASRGYAVFQPNFRGSTGLGASFLRAGWGEWGRKMQTDVSDGLNELARRGIIDPKRACIVGASYGGYVALAGVTIQQGLYRCAVSVAGIGDVQKMLRDDIRESGSDPTLIRALRQTVGTNRDTKAISPEAFAARADAPILLIHGKDDTVVPFSQSNDMLAALKRAGKPAELVTLAGEDHWLSRSETRLTMLKAAVGFVEKHNPADPPASAARQ